MNEQQQSRATTLFYAVFFAFFLALVRKFFSRSK